MKGKFEDRACGKAGTKAGRKKGEKSHLASQKKGSLEEKGAVKLKRFFVSPSQEGGDRFMCFVRAD